MKPIIAKDLLSMVALDLHGPLPVSKANFPYMLVLLNVISMIVKLHPLRNATSVLVTQKFLQNYVKVAGKPTCAPSDRGPRFRSDYWNNNLKAAGILPTKSSV